MRSFWRLPLTFRNRISFRRLLARPEVPLPLALQGDAFVAPRRNPEGEADFVVGAASEARKHLQEPSDPRRSGRGFLGAFVAESPGSSTNRDGQPAPGPSRVVSSGTGLRVDAGCHGGRGRRPSPLLAKRIHLEEGVSEPTEN